MSRIMSRFLKMVVCTTFLSIAGGLVFPLLGLILMLLIKILLALFGEVLHVIPEVHISNSLSADGTMGIYLRWCSIIGLYFGFLLSFYLIRFCNFCDCICFSKKELEHHYVSDVDSSDLRKCGNRRLPVE